MNSTAIPDKPLDKDSALIIGADLSLTDTGIVVLSPAGDVIAAKSIKGKERGIARVIQIRDAIEALIMPIALQFDDVLIVKEDYGASGHNQGRMGELHGAVGAMWYSHRMPVFDVNAMTLKCFVCETGKAEKSDVKLAVFQRWGFQESNNDIVDAFAMAQLGRVIAGQVAPRTVYEKDVIKRMRDYAKKNCHDLNIEMI